jgi:hypothetical protein
VSTRPAWLDRRSIVLGLIGVVSIAFGLYTTTRTHEVLPIVAGVTIVPALWLIEMLVGVTDVRRQTVTSIWFLTYLPMIFWPAFLVYEDFPGPYRNAYLFAVASALITVPVGVALIRRRLSSSRAEAAWWLAKQLDEVRPSRAMFVICVLISITIAGSIFVYFAGIQDIPVLYALRYPGCDLVLGQLREETFKLLDPRWNAVTSTLLFYVYLPLRTIVDPFIVAALFGFWFVSRERRWLGLFVSVFAIAGFYAASSLARAPLAALVLRMLLVFYVLRAGVLSSRAVAVWTLAILAFPVLVTAAAYRPGPPPSDCGPAAGRAPEVGKAAIIDPYLALTTIARQNPGPAVAETPTLGPGVVATGSALVSPTPTPPTAPPAIATGQIPVPTVALSGSPSTLKPVPPTVSPAPTRSASIAQRLGDSFTAAVQVGRRLSYTSAYALYTYFPVFPEQHDWLWGATLWKPIARFWGGDFYVENYVYQKTFPTSAIPTGHLNASFQSNFYADFGLPGVVVGGVVTGAVMHGIEIYVWRRRKTILELATFAVLVYAFWVLHSGSLTSVLLTNGALPVLLIAPTIRLGERILNTWRR